MTNENKKRIIVLMAAALARYHGLDADTFMAVYAEGVAFGEFLERSKDKPDHEIAEHLARKMEELDVGIAPIDRINKPHEKN